MDVGDNVSLTGSMVSLASLSALQKMTTLEVSKAELGETEDIRTASLEKMCAAVKSDPQLGSCVQQTNDLNLDSLEDEDARRFLLRFLRANKFNAAKAKTQLKGYLKMRQSEPMWYTGLGDIDNLGGALELLGNGHVFVAPNRDAMGRVVIVNMASRFVIGHHTYLDQMRAITMTLETLLSVDDDAQVRGIVYIFDCDGLSLRHGLVWSPTDAAKLLTSGQKYWPMRHRSMLVVNTPFGMGAAVDFAKKFMTSENKKRIQVIRGGNKGLAQYSNGVLNQVLPSELSTGGGGDNAATAADMAQAWKETVIRNVKHLKKP